MRPAPERFESLDSWRGICALMVVIYHFCFLVNVDEFRNDFVSNAYLFVDFFFVLSGFVVAHAYAQRLRSYRHVGGFILRRFGRLWPLHGAILFVLMVFVMIINVVGRHPDSLDVHAYQGNFSLYALILHAFMLNSVDLYGNAWNSPAWSIGSEFYTYILFAIVVVLAGRRLLGASLAVSASAITVLFFAAPAYMNSTADFGMVRCIAGFFAGVVAQHIHAATRSKSLPFASGLELAAIGIVALFVMVAGSGPDNVRPTSLMAPLVFAGAVLVFAREGGTLSRMLKVEPFRALGRWSYSIYMVHMPILLLTGYGLWLYGTISGTSLQQNVVVAGHTKQLYDLGSLFGTAMLLGLVLLVVVFIASVTYRLIEDPWRSRFGRIAKRYEVGTDLLKEARPTYVRTSRAVLVPVRVKSEQGKRR